MKGRVEVTLIHILAHYLRRVHAVTNRVTEIGMVEASKEPYFSPKVTKALHTCACIASKATVELIKKW